jgi:hypothetical protein
MLFWTPEQLVRLNDEDQSQEESQEEDQEEDQSQDQSQGQSQEESQGHENRWIPLHGFADAYEIDMSILRIRSATTLKPVRTTCTGRILLSGKWLHIANVIFDHRMSLVESPNTHRCSKRTLGIDTMINICLGSVLTLLIWKLESSCSETKSSWW